MSNETRHPHVLLNVSKKLKNGSNDALSTNLSIGNNAFPIHFNLCSYNYLKGGLGLVGESLIRHRDQPSPGNHATHFAICIYGWKKVNFWG